MMDVNFKWLVWCVCFGKFDGVRMENGMLIVMLYISDVFVVVEVINVEIMEMYFLVEVFDFLWEVYEWIGFVD